MRTVLFIFSLIVLFSCKNNTTESEQALNYDELFSLKDSIELRLNTAVVGETDGTYPQSSYNDLENALYELNEGISKARAEVFVLQFEVDSYVLEAKKAIRLFDQSVNVLLPPGTPAELFVNGVDHKGYIDFGSSPDYCGGPKFTVEAWTKYDEGFIETAFGSFLSTFISPLPYKGWTLHYWGASNSLLRFSIGTDNSNPDLTLPTIYTSAPSEYGKWFHVAAVFDSNLKKQMLYINGELKSTADISDNMVVNSPDDMRMWAFVEPKDNSRCMSGYIKKFRIWSTSKTVEEINTLMVSDVVGDEPGLVCAWDFVETPENSEEMIDKTGRHTAKLVGVYKWKEVKE
ncbi:LamG domain-containing protein [Phocaeicola sp. KGMB11183]|uniref:LamG domain-containing protein n=1 Tax=Phocaeicola acetigenes TaxID=3016083 RepID=A0ABT4PF39_9BACT|nr:LamG domain-containing protein [Phocaeicola sp. KGMB11183]MCZ8371668.1 LamG domain-containing protein [Phocaeicola sp. KGMB11183]